MLILTGKNLGERQRELNIKVNEAVEKNVDFEQVKATTENSDVDKLYKIDLASKYKNIDYMIEVLKSVDSLYISRALKCVWMFDDEYSNVISVNNLHNHVFPFMSTKMKKKLLSAISTHVRNEDRAAAFYKYCMDIKYTGIALKFLNFTSDSFKLELLKDKSNCHYFMSGPIAEHLKNFVGNSFTLANAYVAIFHKSNRIHVLRALSYLYAVSDDKYLDMLEKSIVLNSYINNSYLGIRLSKNIMKNHKNRVIRNPALYVGILNKNVLIRYSTAKDAATYLIAVLPDTVEFFWHINYYKTFKYIIGLLTDKKYEFVKTIFTAKYPRQEFEMTVNFYRMHYYTLMTAQEQETWALKHIASEAEMLGSGKDYIWYKFVSFEKAFEEIKKLIRITPESTKRADMVNILIESAKNQRDVEKLLKHYYDRHINEQKYAKENFLNNILHYFNVYEFDENCWMAINMIFHSLDVYSMTDFHNCKSEYKIIALIYSIINKKDIHEAIKVYIHTNMNFYTLKTNTNKLSKDDQEMVFHYLFEFYMDEIRNYENVQYDDGVRHILRKYIYYILDLLDQFNKGSHNCPELVNKFMKLDWDEFKFHRLHHVKNKSTTPADWIRYLKTDAQLLIKHLPLLKSNINSSYTYHISLLLNKLKVYFSNDIAQVYVRFFDEMLTEDPLCHKEAHAAVHGIFQLAVEKFKIDFMTKYAPTEPKINHAAINDKLLRIQEAICAHLCYSRPPVPLKYILMYIKGDYVHACFPMFPSYLSNLPLPLCIEFIEAILNTPISIQKHGIRLAFECFNTENLNQLVLHAWNRTKNVSLRMKIFKALFNKTADEQALDVQQKLFTTLKTITLTLHEDDDEQVFELLVSRKLPKHLLLEYIEAAWTVVHRLTPKPTNINRMRTFIEYIDNQFNLIGQNVARLIVDDFIASVFSVKEANTSTLKYDTIALDKAKWDLTAKYVTYVQSKEDIDMKLELVKDIFKKCLGPLDSGIYEKKYVLRQLCFNFIKNLEYKSYSHDFECYENVNLIMQFILKTLQDTLCIEEIYILVWELQLGILARKVIYDTEKKCKYKNKLEVDMRFFNLKDIATDFAEALGNLIMEFVQKEIYFTSFFEDIKMIINNKIQTVMYHFDIHMKTDMLIGISCSLMQFEITEIYLLVLNLIPPVNNIAYDGDFKFMIDKIKMLDNKEIRCILFQKFVNSDFEVRDFMHS